MTILAPDISKLTLASVAEIAEKPLYRVTCADIGTNPEVVEKVAWVLTSFLGYSYLTFHSTLRRFYILGKYGDVVCRLNENIGFAWMLILLQWHF